MTAERASLAPLAYGLMLLMNAIWGISYPAVKSGLDHHSPLGLVALRFGVATLTLAPLLAAPWPRLRAHLGATAKHGCLTGLALLSGFVLQAFGMTETSASVGGFLSGLIVLVVGLGAWLVFREPMRTATAIGLVAGLAGVVLLCTNSSEPTASAPQDSTWGILLQTGAAASFATHILLMSRLSPGRAEGELAGRDLAFSFWQLSIVAVGATAALVVSGSEFTLPDSHHFDAWIEMLYLGVLATGIAIAIQSRYQPLVRPDHLALLFATQPLFAALGGWVLLGDSMTGQQFAGCGAILVGVLIAARGRP
ncbi:MAG: DMT family transporter [Planctomycetota bacterium]